MTVDQPLGFALEQVEPTPLPAAGRPGASGLSVVAEFLNHLAALMPLVLFSALFLMDREFISLLLNEAVGRMGVATSITLQLLAFLWIRKAVNLEM